MNVECFCEENPCVCVCFNCGAGVDKVGTNEVKDWCSTTKTYIYTTIINLYESKVSGERVCSSCYDKEEEEEDEEDE